MQNCASLALIDRLKQARPDVVAVVGGANDELPYPDYDDFFG